MSFLLSVFKRSGRYQILGFIALLYLCLSLILRLSLGISFGTEAKVGLAEFPLVLLLGFINDCFQLIYLLVPFTLFLWLFPSRLLNQKIGQFILFTALFFCFFGMLYLTVAEYFFFEEFNARFNLVAVDYLIYPHEVFINIWESYPVLPVLIFTTLFSLALVYWTQRQTAAELLNSFYTFKIRFFILALHTVLITVVATVISTNTLDFSHNRVTNEMTANGVSSFFQAIRTNELDYKAYYHTDDSKQLLQKIATRLSKDNSQFTHLEEGRLTRQFIENPQGLGKLNVVVIVEESFGSEFVGRLGDTRHLTPNFDKLSSQGLLFSNTYASGTRTVRGLEAITLSFPPIPSESVVKRPKNENMASWGSVMREKGYHTSFLYGGFGYFDNMNAFYAGNGFEISDRQSIANPKFTNIWGVSDEDLFNHAVDYFNQRTKEAKPFFSIIMSTSNHKPYTFPEGIPNVPSHGGGRDAGVRYADYAIGKFFENAQKQTWYNNTVFVIVADHGARVYGKAEIPLYSYQIPLLVLAPSHLNPQEITRPTSQIDIAPTVLGLLGFSYEAPFFGRNVLALPADEPSILLFNHNHKVALAQNDKLAILGLQQSVNYEAYDAKTRNFASLPPDTEAITLATAYFQLGFELFQQQRYH